MFSGTRRRLVKWKSSREHANDSPGATDHTILYVYGGNIRTTTALRIYTIFKVGQVGFIYSAVDFMRGFLVFTTSVKRMRFAHVNVDA